MIDLTEYKYFRPLDKSIGYFGINHTYLLNCDREYFLNPDRLYQIMGSYYVNDYYQEHNFLYEIMDLKTLETYILVIPKHNTLKVFKRLFDLIKS